MQSTLEVNLQRSAAGNSDATNPMLLTALEFVSKHKNVLGNLPPDLTIGEIIGQATAYAYLQDTESDVLDTHCQRNYSDNYGGLLPNGVTPQSIAHAVDGIDTGEKLVNILRSVEQLHFWQQAQSLAGILNSEVVYKNFGKFITWSYNDESEELDVSVGHLTPLSLHSRETYEEFMNLFATRSHYRAGTIADDGESIVSREHGKVDPAFELLKLDSSQSQKDYENNLAIPKYAKSHILRRVCEEGPFGIFNERSDHSSVYLQVHGVDLVSFRKAGLSWLPQARARKKAMLSSSSPPKGRVKHLISWGAANPLFSHNRFTVLSGTDVDPWIAID